MQQSLPVFCYVLCQEFVTKQAGTKGKEVELKRGVRKCLAQQRSSLSEACASAEFHEAKREAGDARLANSGQLAESCKDELVCYNCLLKRRDVCFVSFKPGMFRWLEMLPRKELFRTSFMPFAG